MDLILFWGGSITESDGLATAFDSRGPREGCSKVVLAQPPSPPPLDPAPTPLPAPSLSPQGRASLDSFRGLIFVGGFSYADTLDSAKGWAAAIRQKQEELEEQE